MTNEDEGKLGPVIYQGFCKDHLSWIQISKYDYENFERNKNIEAVRTLIVGGYMSREEKVGKMKEEIYGELDRIFGILVKKYVWINKKEIKHFMKEWAANDH